MRDLDTLEKLIVRSWSAVVARGDEPTPEAVAALAGHSVEAVAAHIQRLTILGAIPGPELEAAS